MRTTVRLRDDLLQAAKARAAAEGRTLTSLIEEGLTAVLGRPRQERASCVELPVSKETGGARPGVDLDDARQLADVMGDLDSP